MLSRRTEPDLEDQRHDWRVRSDSASHVPRTSREGFFFNPCTLARAHKIQHRLRDSWKTRWLPFWSAPSFVARLLAFTSVVCVMGGTSPLLCKVGCRRWSCRCDYCAKTLVTLVTAKRENVRHFENIGSRLEEPKGSMLVLHVRKEGPTRERQTFTNLVFRVMGPDAVCRRDSRSVTRSASCAACCPRAARKFYTLAGRDTTAENRQSVKKIHMERHLQPSSKRTENGRKWTLFQISSGLVEILLKTNVSKCLVWKLREGRYVNNDILIFKILVTTQDTATSNTMDVLEKPRFASSVHFAMT